MSIRSDFLIVGGGIVGCCTAYSLMRRNPNASIVLVEKEPRLAAHQTGRNSGVIHSGIYYKPGSLKARFCREGKALLEQFCTEHGIAFDICGKVIVAVQDSEKTALQRIFERGTANGVACRQISRAELRELEPHVEGVAGLAVPETGIVNYASVTEAIAKLITISGHQIRRDEELLNVQNDGADLVVETSRGSFRTALLINCAGVYADRVARLCGLQPSVQIIPFRGEYFELIPAMQGLCKNLIYPVPDPNFPFLGVHFTRMIGGGVECGPNAVFALGREAYSKFGITPEDLLESLQFSGFRRFAARHWRTGMGEIWRSLSKAAFVRALQRLLPEIEAHHLVPAEPGIRAQALTKEGNLVDDFAIERTARAIHVLNAPSPAATAGLRIGEEIAEQVTKMN